MGYSHVNFAADRRGNFSPLVFFGGAHFHFAGQDTNGML